ncbi:MAG: Sir2 family NAD-dependent protein deacetylase [Bacillota bacterium]
MNKIEMIANRLNTARSPLILTGAGVSTHLGIPDFRSDDDGLYSGTSSMMDWMTEDYRRDYPQEFQQKLNAVVSSIKERAPRYDEIVDHKGAEPVHEAIDEIARRCNAAIVTQNVDALHRIIAERSKSAVRIIEAHGSSADYDKIVLFGSQMPLESIALIREVTAGKYDYCLVLGSSLNVFPIGGIPDMIRNYDIVVKEKSSVPSKLQSKVLETDVAGFVRELLPLIKK